MDLWNFYDNEPWLDNPAVFINPRRKRTSKTKGKKTMARRRKRSGYRRAPRRVRRRVYRRRRSAAVRSNPPVARLRRRRRVRRSLGTARRRRTFRRNPLNVAGLNLTELLKGAGAVIIAPMLEKQILPLLPATVSGTSYGRWAVKIGAALGTWYAAKAAFGRRSADVVAIALGSNLIADAVDEFAPQLTGGLAAYTRPRLAAYSPVGRRGLGLVMPGQVGRSGLRGVNVSRDVRLGVSPAGDLFAPPF